MSPVVDRRTLQDPQQILEALESFLQAAKSPVLVEDGRQALAIVRDRLRIEATPSGVILESWGPQGAVIRRLTSIASVTRTRIELRAKRFAQRDIRLSIIDSAAASVAGSTDGHSSQIFLKRLIAREFPLARVSKLSGHSDLQHSLSGRHVRCRMDEGQLSWAVVAAPPMSSAESCDCAITTGLLWLDSLRQMETRRPIVGLRIFLPLGRQERPCRILRGLNLQLAVYEVYAYDPRGNVQKIDLANAGNTRTLFRARYRPAAFGPPLLDWLAQLEQRPWVATVAQANGSLSLRILGLEFAAARAREMVYGLQTQTVVTQENFGDVLKLVDQLASFRNPNAADRDHPLYRADPERWLESRIRRDIQNLDPSLGGTPLFSQSEAAAGLDRGIIDLITADQSGRLAILEVKATANLQLPIQALDYWVAVDAIIRTSPDLITSYFPDLPVSQASPRLILIAPALEFHPTTELITGYFGAQVPLERIGLNAGWRTAVKKRYHQLDRGRPDCFRADTAAV
ncbi:MAG: hypothetical protein O3A53_07565 [Acidobacteria bacterium]|nr:hypothetical protein [Acidobacteriota bacterium]